jgi:hypothetical protein
LCRRNHKSLDYVTEPVARLTSDSPGDFRSFGTISMTSQTPLTKDPAAYMWEVAVTIAARRQFCFSPECEANLKERLKAGLKVFKVGLYEFRERISEAETNIEKLVQLTISEEIAGNPASKLLHESSMFDALYDRKLCPGIWPIC